MRPNEQTSLMKSLITFTLLDCRRLFSLAWYDDLTYADEVTSDESILKKPLPKACCNGPSCNNPEPEYLRREPFIQYITTKYSKSDREWMACQTIKLKEWRKETAARIWLKQGVDEDEELPDNLIMDDTCLTALAKNGELLQDLPTIIEFLKPWYGMARYAEEILVCIQKNSSFIDLPDLPTKAERKSTLAAARTSKKLKGLDDPVLAEESCMTAMRDAWLVDTGKANAATKT